MANPFFSGRIPPGLAIQIDAYLLDTGETRSELLVRLLRSVVNDNKPDNKADNNVSDLITNLLLRVERLEQLIDNNTDNAVDNKLDSIEIVAAVETEPEVISLTMKALAERLKVSTKRLIANLENDESWRELMKANPDPESRQWSRPVKVGKTWRIDGLASVQHLTPTHHLN